ncbi:hypothetical protein BMT55_02715 [Listeria newyorkensis]|uniref:ArnR1-like winged helix-turn-helix domain-containing protein n=1 Tax=Listeria newyorkensis TaxID=1497681 RepID=A0ABX4XQC1_9LIST|nr:hypothetical protein [Listeria newyorkensis]KGL38305.1 hypothetical protein EP58_16240 [Listeria newyorkensis]PNP94417.1 hypothetical protein BMT55_02715 [Listeria newyorkensis]WAO22827.1 hypothetical protein OTR81_06035 [Listeria newyorkensis]SQC58689.1 Uncharacterised protein [Listeria newyorkensis]
MDKKRYQKLWNLAFLKLVMNEKSVASIIPEDIDKFEENLERLKNNNIILDVDNGITITNKGLEYIDQIERELDLMKIDKFIFPEFEHIVDKLDENEIYLP